MRRRGPSAHCSCLPQESQDLFCCLYRSWCHNPVTTVSLCFLTQNYRHAYDLIQKLYPSLSVLPVQPLEGWAHCHPPAPRPVTSGRMGALREESWPWRSRVSWGSRLRDHLGAGAGDGQGHLLAADRRALCWGGGRKA